MKNWKAVAGVMLVFALGALSGALVAHRFCQHRFENMMHGGPKAVGDFIVKKLGHELDLDQSQKDEVSKIVSEAHSEMDALKKQFRPQMDAIINKSEDRVRAILKPEQRERFEKFVKEREERMERREKGE